MLISCRVHETLSLGTKTDFIFLVAWLLALAAAQTQPIAATVRTGSARNLNLNLKPSASDASNQILRLINTNHNHEPTLASSPASRNEFVLISEGSRVRTRPYDFIFDQSTLAHKANKSSQPFEPSIRNFYLLTAEINQPNSNQNQNQTQNQTHTHTLTENQNQNQTHQSAPETSSPSSDGNVNSSLKLGETIRSQHLAAEGRASLAPRVKLNLLRQKLVASYSRRPSRTKFFRLISSAHSPIQLAADETHSEPDASPNSPALTNRSGAETRSGQVARFPAIDPFQSAQFQPASLNQLAQGSPSSAPAAEEATNRSLAESSQGYTLSAGPTDQQPSASLQYSELPAISDGRLLSPALWVSDDDTAQPTETTKTPTWSAHSELIARPNEQLQPKRQPDELVRAAQNNLTVLDPIPEANQTSPASLASQLDDRRRPVVTFSQTDAISVKPAHDGLTHVVVVKSGASRMRPVAIMRHRPLVPAASLAQPVWLDPTGPPTNLSLIQEHTSTQTGRAKPLQLVGSLVIKKDPSKQRVKISIPQAPNHDKTFALTTSSPQLVRLISKQRHKHEDRVTSPTLTVIDNDAVRVPFNATSVHNNKLIVTIRPGRPYRRQPLTPTTQFPVYNIVAGITPPYLTGTLPSQAHSTKPPVRQNYGLISKLPDDSIGPKPTTTPVPFRATNIKFPAQVPSSLMVDRGPETQMSIIDKLNISVPANDPSILRPSKSQPPNKIQMETEEQLVRPPTEAIVVSDTTVVSRPFGSNVSHHGGGIIKLSTTRRPLKPPPTKKINIVSANTTVVTGNPEDVHDALSNFIAESHHPSNHGQNRPTNRPGILEFLNNIVNTGLATSSFAILTLVKTIFISLFILFLPPIALTAAIMQAVSG